MSHVTAAFLVQGHKITTRGQPRTRYQPSRDPLFLGLFPTDSGRENHRKQQKGMGGGGGVGGREKGLNEVQAHPHLMEKVTVFPELLYGQTAFLFEEPHLSPQLQEEVAD